MCVQYSLIFSFCVNSFSSFYFSPLPINKFSSFSSSLVLTAHVEISFNFDFLLAYFFCDIKFVCHFHFKIYNFFCLLNFCHHSPAPSLLVFCRFFFCFNNSKFVTPPPLYYLLPYSVDYYYELCSIKMFLGKNMYFIFIT